MCEHRGDRIERAFGAGVDGGSGCRAEGRDRADIDDRAALSRKVLKRLFDRQQRAKNVDVEMPAVVRFGDVLDRREFIDAGIVDEDVEPAESLLRRIEQRLDVGCL